MPAYGVGVTVLEDFEEGIWAPELALKYRGCQAQYPSGTQMHVGFQGNQVWVSGKMNLDQGIPRCSGAFLLLYPAAQQEEKPSGNR